MKNKEQSSQQFDRLTPQGFTSPEKLPEDQLEAEEWQAANRNFWESSPMLYDWNDEIKIEKGTRQFFEEIDRRFIGATMATMPWENIPYDNLIPYAEIKGNRVLEIGVGQGTHAALIAPHVADYVGIDLTEHAVEMTTKRLELNTSITNMTIKQMDAEKLEFEDNSFDFIWSWGVIHHSSNTSKIFGEMKRVLKPGGRAIVMVYHRGWWNYYLIHGLIRGIFCGKFLRYKALSSIVQAYTDGAIARYYSKKSWAEAVKNYFDVRSIEISGNDSEIVPIPNCRLKKFLLKMIPDCIKKLFLVNFCMGSFLISRMVKEQA